MKSTSKLTLKASLAGLSGLAAAFVVLPHDTVVSRMADQLTDTLIISQAQAAQTRVYHMRVDGMTCPFCAKTSQKALRAIPGVKSVSTNLKRGVITVCASPSAHLTASRMRSLFAAKGFTFRSMSTGKSC